MRPSDWSALDLAHDPVPGNPSIVLVGGQDYLDVARAIDRAEKRLRNIDLGSTKSDAADALAEKSQQVADNIAKAHKRYLDTGDALVQYAPALDAAQRESIDALATARAARNNADASSTRRHHYLRLADEESDAQQAIVYRDLAERQEVDAASAHSHLAAARAQLDGAMSHRDRAAEAAEEKIKKIVKNDGLNDGWWENWGKDVLSTITDIAGWVSTIAGVLALVVCWIPVVGQALAAALLLVAGIAAIIDAIGNIVLASTGDRSWTDAGISIVGAALSVVGMGGAARLLGKAASAARINARAATEIAAGGAQKLTLRQTLHLKPSELSGSEKLWRTPLPELKEGDQLFRAYGDKALQDGASFSTMDPRDLKNARALLGLPDVNSAKSLVITRVDDLSNLRNTRHALPLDGQPGGAAEFIFPGKFGDGKGLTVLDDLTFAVR